MKKPELINSFDGYELELKDTGTAYQIFGHLKSGGVRIIAEAGVEDFDTRVEAEELAEYIFNLLENDLKKGVKTP